MKKLPGLPYCLKLAFTSFLILVQTLAGAQIDPDASEKTKTLYSNLKKIQNGNSFLFGQEFFNSFRFSSGGFHTDKEYSDCKAVTGAHPSLLGSDFHYYLEKQASERTAHTEAVKWAYQQGYVITFDWHLSGRGTTTYAYNAGSPSANLVNNIVGNVGDDRTWFYGELDKVIAIINNDLVVAGEKIPTVFRPLHEMNGGWFWWGSSATSADNYKALYRLLVDYVKERTTTVLFCWSPNTPTSMNHFPGNDYVDVLGLDIYEATANNLRTQIAPIVDHAQANNKVAVLSETGNRVNSDNASTYWKNTVLPAIMDDPSGKAKKIAWVLTWINASWSFPYAPHTGSGAAAKQSFIDFKNSPAVLFGDEITNMYAPIPDAPEVPVAVTEEFRQQDHIDIFVESGQILVIRLDDLNGNTNVTISDIMGRPAMKARSAEPETTVPLGGLMRSGVYILKAMNGKKVLSKKFVTTGPVNTIRFTK
jgi:mannan endo-1,4-beta-mannosidase